MEIILLEDFPALGYVGDRVRVRPGYARNFLLPRGVAAELTNRNARLMAHQMAVVNAKRAKLKAQAQELASSVSGIKLDFKLKVGKNLKSFGSISVRDIENELKKLGHDFDRKRIKLPEPIRKAGEYRVEVKLHSEVSATIAVLVEAEIVVAEEPTEKPSRKKGRRAVEDTDELDFDDESGDSSGEAIEEDEVKNEKGKKARSRKVEGA